MPTTPIAIRDLSIVLEEKPMETIIHCTGKVTGNNSEAFQKEICDLIPNSRVHADAITCRIVLDLTNVSYVDSAGLGALLGRMDDGAGPRMLP